MYESSPVIEVNPRTLGLGEKCPAALGPTTRRAKPQLERWKLVSEVCAAWLRTAEKTEEVARRISDDHLAWMDPVQRAIVDQAFATFRRMFPDTDPASVGFDVGPAAALADSGSRSLSVHGQFEISEPDGQTSVFRLKTGRPRAGAAYVTTEVELAVIDQEADGRPFFEVRTRDGVVEPLVFEGDSRLLVDEAFRRHEALEDEGTQVRRPGLHCLDCDRPSTCGQYPITDRQRPRARDRAVAVTKSRLPTLDQCERRVAWRVLYGIPQDESHDSDAYETRYGRHFHEAAAAAIPAEDPDEVFRTLVRDFPQSEASDLLSYWDQHRQLVASEPFPVDVRHTEYPLGGTWVVPGPDLNAKTGELREDVVAVVLIGFADAVGREASGLAAVVDHKTGADTAVPYEAELYAVGASLLLRTDEVAVHRHQLTLGREPRCDRVVFDQDRLRGTTELLAERAERIAAWHPNNALHPTYQVNPSWCSHCEFEDRCRNYRTAGA